LDEDQTPYFKPGEYEPSDFHPTACLSAV
jgi:hypothetical protein